VLWDLPRVQAHRVSSCGRQGVLPGGSVRIRATGAGADRRAGFSGLASCGSVWACPVCSERILAGRQTELSEGLASWSARGGRVAFVTLTMRHDKGQSLRSLWDALSKAWDNAVKGRAWKAARARYGVAGFIRVVEVTHGDSGWHVHVHAAFLLDGSVPITSADVDDLGCVLFQPWRASLMRSGLRAPLARSGGLDAKLWDGSTGVMADYFAKGTYAADASRAALELARGDLKIARSGNRTPFRILADFVEFGVLDDLELWQEWERGSKGRRQMTWSRGLRDLLLAGPELTDQELADAELGTVDDDLVELDAATWKRVRDSGVAAALLDLAEQDDFGHLLRSGLDRLGLPYRDVRVFVG
jgi:hypothetical protein